MSSFVEVPGDTPAFYDSKPVPHGEVRMVLYESKPMGVTRCVWIYTPPNYDKGRAKYPVLYLLHGNGEALSVAKKMLLVPPTMVYAKPPVRRGTGFTHAGTD
jgi:predicted alpha/beta superfamily hydrolase